MDIKDRVEALKHLRLALGSFQSFVLLTQKNYSKQDVDRALKIAGELRSFETFVEKTYSEPNFSTNK